MCIERRQTTEYSGQRKTPNSVVPGSLSAERGPSLLKELTSMVAQSIPVVLCTLCHSETDHAEAGVCRHCRERLPRIGGCGLALTVAASIIASGEASSTHLEECADCREALDTVA